jgi:hypothetical protein
MDGSGARVFGNLFIAAALPAFGLSGGEAVYAVIGAGLLVSGCLLRIEAAILSGQPRASDLPPYDPARAWRRPRGQMLHLPERAGGRRPWQEPEDENGPEPHR